VLFLKNEMTDTKNYRPISLLTSFSKNFERVIFNRIQSHIDAINIIAQDQYGFRTKSSTELTTYNVRNNILLAQTNKTNSMALSP
jgi:hypothetical protein